MLSDEPLRRDPALVTIPGGLPQTVALGDRENQRAFLANCEQLF
jgi:hypothetical protein